MEVGVGRDVRFYVRDDSHDTFGDVFEFIMVRKEQVLQIICQRHSNDEEWMVRSLFQWDNVCDGKDGGRIIIDPSTNG